MDLVPGEGRPGGLGASEASSLQPTGRPRPLDRGQRSGWARHRELGQYLGGSWGLHVTKYVHSQHLFVLESRRCGVGVLLSSILGKEALRFKEGKRLRMVHSKLETELRMSDSKSHLFPPPISYLLSEKILGGKRH